MRPFTLLPYYLQWHYTEALRSCISIIRNLIWFSWHLFSIGILLKTLFSPWQRLQEARPQGIDLGNIVGTYVINIMMRVAGAVIRLTVIAAGLITTTVILILGACFFLLWLAFPVCIIVFIVFGIVLLFK